MIDIENYDENNIFAKILRKEIPSDVLYEDEEVYAFKDINPQAPVHILIIPKKAFCSFTDFSSHAKEDTIVSLVRSIEKIAKDLKLNDGYRVISNVGSNGGQEVPHFHLHLLAGKNLGRMVP